MLVLLIVLTADSSCQDRSSLVAARPGCGRWSHWRWRPAGCHQGGVSSCWQSGSSWRTLGRRPGACGPSCPQVVGRQNRAVWRPSPGQQDGGPSGTGTAGVWLQRNSSFSDDPQRWLRRTHGESEVQRMETRFDQITAGLFCSSQWSLSRISEMLNCVVCTSNCWIILYFRFKCHLSTTLHTRKSLFLVENHNLLHFILIWSYFFLVFFFSRISQICNTLSQNINKWPLFTVLISRTLTHSFHSSLKYFASQMPNRA